MFDVTKHVFGRNLKYLSHSHRTLVMTVNSNLHFYWDKKLCRLPLAHICSANKWEVEEIHLLSDSYTKTSQDAP